MVLFDKDGVPSVGATWSSLTVTFASAVLPALSSAVPDNSYVPSLDSLCGDGHSKMPGPPLLSVQVKLTVKGACTQPPLFRAGETEDVMVGAVRSTTTSTLLLGLLSLPLITVVTVYVSEPS